MIRQERHDRVVDELDRLAAEQDLPVLHEAMELLEAYRRGVGSVYKAACSGASDDAASECEYLLGISPS